MELKAEDINFGSTAAIADGWRLLDDVELMQLPDPQYLIDSVLPEKGLTVIYGPSGACKTTLDANVNVALATGRDWFGHPVRRMGASIYVGAEDVSGWKVRLASAKRAAGYSLEDVIGCYCFPEPLDLRAPEAVARFIRFARETEQIYLRVTFDTFAASTPGASENSSEDMTAAMAAAQKVRDELGVNVTLIHHTNAGGSRERGHSAMRGAADTMISITPVDDLIHVECSKQRNGPPFEPITLKLLPLPGGGCVLRLASDVLAGSELTTLQAKVFGVLRETFGAGTGATKSEWRSACQDVPERSFHRAAKMLAERGYVRQSGAHFVASKVAA
jgi:hypothetical protein